MEHATFMDLAAEEEEKGCRGIIYSASALVAQHGRALPW
jgi:hypothetical protein